MFLDDRDRAEVEARAWPPNVEARAYLCVAGDVRDQLEVGVQNGRGKDFEETPKDFRARTDFVLFSLCAVLTECGYARPWY